MRLSSVLLHLFYFFLYPAGITTVVLYLYPLFTGCGFPQPPQRASEVCVRKDGFLDSVAKLWTPGPVAPFRLLALADPQLEGDSSLPKSSDYRSLELARLWVQASPSNPRKALQDISTALGNLILHDIPLWLRASRKRLDLLGNDFYLAHIYRTLHWWLAPTHVAVLGDLVGSQWVHDAEFEERGRRYWQRVFKGGSRIEEDIMKSGPVEVLGADTTWRNRIINIAGNHDIGYAGDIDRHTIDRFERMYGDVNWHISYRLPPSENASEARNTAELRLVVLNSMNLDGPGLNSRLQQSTYSFLNEQVIAKSRVVEDRTAATVLLTHIPLRKEAGICADAPFFDFGQNGIREQNTLSTSASKGILEGMYGMSSNPNAAALGRGRNGIILNGHDHVGCDVFHYISANTSRDGDDWKATRWTSQAQLPPSSTGIREVTVRSMMGEFDGNAGLLSAWFDEGLGEWRFEYGSCKLGVQHLWWAVHGLDLFVTALLLGANVAVLVERQSTARPKFLGGRSIAEKEDGAEQKKASVSKTAEGNAIIAGATDIRRSTR